MFKYMNDSKRKCVFSVGEITQVLAPGQIATFNLDIKSTDVVVFKSSDNGKVTIEVRQEWRGQ